MFFSIIVSVYNLEEYIDKCINSLLSQNLEYSQYEIIVIDDGSTDHSLQKIKDFANTYSNVRVISKSNGGVSSVRNLGISLAKGEYIWFIDGDDWILENTLCSLKKTIEDKKIDILYLNYSYIDVYGNILFVTNSKSNAIISGEEFFCSAPGDFIMPWRFIIRKQFIQNNNLFFIEGITFEDDEWAPRVLYYTTSLFVYESPVYYYLKRSTSLMASFSETKIPSFLKVIESLSKFDDEITVESKFKYNLRKYILQYISNYLRYRLKRGIVCDYDIAEIKRITPSNLNGLSLKKQIQGVFIKRYPLLYSYLFAIK